MRGAVVAADLEADGLAPETARMAGQRASAAILRNEGTDTNARVQLWRDFRQILQDLALRTAFPFHLRLYRIAYDGRPNQEDPAPVWEPDPEDARTTHIGALIGELGLRSYEELHRWSVENREAFWSTTIRK